MGRLGGTRVDLPVRGDRVGGELRDRRAQRGVLVAEAGKQAPGQHQSSLFQDPMTFSRRPVSAASRMNLAMSSGW